MNLALLRLEQDDGAPPLPSPPPPSIDGAPPPPRNHGASSATGSVAGHTGFPRPLRADEDDNDGDFLLTYHKLDFPKCDGSNDPLT
jgi:hypothetical protein